MGPGRSSSGLAGSGHRLAVSRLRSRPSNVIVPDVGSIAGRCSGERRLAATRLAHDGERLSRPYLERDVIDGLDHAARPAKHPPRDREVLHQVFDAQKRSILSDGRESRPDPVATPAGPRGHDATSSAATSFRPPNRRARSSSVQRGPDDRRRRAPALHRRLQERALGAATSITYRQRGLNAHPAGVARSDGGAPGIERILADPTFIAGSDDRRPQVYGCAGRTKMTRPTPAPRRDRRT